MRRGVRAVVLSAQVIVVNYEDKLTTMEAPDDQDEVSYKCARALDAQRVNKELLRSLSAVMHTWRRSTTC